MSTFKRLVGNDFSADNTDWRSKKRRKMVHLHQELFTMVYEFNGLHEVFKDDMDLEYLSPYVYEGNPMCYIPSVTYGRSMIFLFESDDTFSSDSTLNKAIQHALNDSLYVITDSDRAILAKTKVSLHVMGGNADDALQVISGNPDEIRKYIMSSVTKAGVPLYYSLRYLGNNWNVNTYKEINTTYEELEYVEEEKENNVEITFKKVKSNALYLTGGNYDDISNDSKFTVSQVKVEVIDGNSIISSKTQVFNPNITNQGAKSSFEKKLQPCCGIRKTRERHPL